MTSALRRFQTNGEPLQANPWRNFQFTGGVKQARSRLSGTVASLQILRPWAESRQAFRQPCQGVGGGDQLLRMAGLKHHIVVKRSNQRV